ncbi:ABC-type transport system involved in cytochrome bd biosynthesis fused ATPase/permease subunit [Marisediminicola sp. UYEF4]|uniref:SCO4848 family membrane protein n=1 Tax=Marisediminicola sp. UYEF4 TaxID=1756384 RepID=UPI0033995EF9
MTITLAVLLLVNAAFNLLVWPTFYRRVARDVRARDAAGRATRFLKVHAVLIGLALVIAAVSAVAAIASLVGAW